MCPIVLTKLYRYDISDIGNILKRGCYYDGYSKHRPHKTQSTSP